MDNPIPDREPLGGSATATSCETPLIVGRDIRKEFKSGEIVTKVLHGIDVEICPGEVTFLVGPSGCGKTTLISILSAILSPTGGTAEVDGRNLFAMSDGKRVKFRRENCGFIFQQYSLLAQLTAAENAAVTLVAAGVPLKTAADKASALLAKLGLDGQQHKRPNQLSGGQQQRVAIARALVHEPRFLVADEPTAALDEASGQNVMRLLRDVAGSPGRAVLVVTHDNRIYDFADRIIEMNDGRITGDTRNTRNTKDTADAHAAQ